jgi:hypothetical protein
MQRAVMSALASKRARKTSDTPSTLFGAGMSILAPPDAESDWRGLELDGETLSRETPTRLLELLVNVSPDISRALWDFLRFCNPGFEADALAPGPAESIDTRAQAALDGFLASLKARHGSLDIVINRLFIAAFMRGAFLGELVLDQSGRLPLDIATPDPKWVQFEHRKDPTLGEVYVPFYWRGGKREYLDVETVRYLPVDPVPGSPFGRSLAAPALFTAIFALGLMHDLRRVVSQQGYPRLDVSILSDVLQKIIPGEALADPVELKRWVDAAIADVQTAYDALQPDDAYIHLDTVQVNRPVGTVDSSSLGAVDGLLRALERQVVRALKTNPLLFGLDQTTNEAQANRQWETHVAGIKAIQHLGESLLEHLLTIALRVQGYQSTVRFRFAELRASELLRDAQVTAMNLKNARAAYDNGLVDQDGQAKMALGLDKADQPAPRVVQAADPAGGADPMDDNPDPGSMRACIQYVRGVEPSGTDLGAVPSEVTVSDAEVDSAEAAFDLALPNYAGLLSAEVV